VPEGPPAPDQEVERGYRRRATTIVISLTAMRRLARPPNEQDVVHTPVSWFLASLIKKGIQNE
jgi:hypothetical protein